MNLIQLLLKSGVVKTREQAVTALLIFSALGLMVTVWYYSRGMFEKTFEPEMDSAYPELYIEDRDA